MEWLQASAPIKVQQVRDSAHLGDVNLFKRPSTGCTQQFPTNLALAFNRLSLLLQSSLTVTRHTVGKRPVTKSTVLLLMVLLQCDGPLRFHWPLRSKTNHRTKDSSREENKQQTSGKSPKKTYSDQLQLCKQTKSIAKFRTLILKPGTLYPKPSTQNPTKKPLACRNADAKKHVLVKCKNDT